MINIFDYSPINEDAAAARPYKYLIEVHKWVVKYERNHHNIYLLITLIYFQ